MDDSLDNINNLLIEYDKRRPKVLHRDSLTLESEREDIQREVIEVGDKKVVVEIFELRTVTRYTIIREHNPETSYTDALDIFTKGE